MPILALSLGSNIDAEANIRRAVELLRARWPDLRLSRVYESEAVGFTGNNFLNLVAIADVDEPLAGIVAQLKTTEDELGRDRTTAKYAPRSMDIDILLFGDDDGADCGITLPRPEITRNAYVLCPLAELLPDRVHPPTGATYRALWEAYDKTAQRLWPIAFEA